MVTGVAGNSAVSNVVAVVVEKPPLATTTASINSVTEGAGGVLVSSGGVSGGKAPLVVNGTLTSALAVGETLRLFDDNTFLGNATVTGSTWMYTDRRVLSAGQTVVYRARVEDSAGNQSASANTYVVSLSPIAPVISLHDMQF